MIATESGPSSGRTWKPSRYAAATSATKSASLPKLWNCRPQRGSVQRSICGCRAERMPTAQYSWRAISANSRIRSGSCSAPSPSGSGHSDIAPAANAAPTLAVKP